VRIGASAASDTHRGDEGGELIVAVEGVCPEPALDCDRDSASSHAHSPDAVPHELCVMHEACTKLTCAVGDARGGTPAVEVDGVPWVMRMRHCHLPRARNCD